jgi:hypothetical protein
MATKKKKKLSNNTDEEIDDDIVPNGLDFEFGEKPKSQSRHIMEKMYKESFIKGYEGDYDVILLDALQIIKDVGNGHCNPAIMDGSGKQMTGKELVVAVKYAAEYYLKNTNCSVYVMMFDKIEKVPATKGETQSHRDESKKFYSKEGKMFDNSKSKETIQEIEDYIEKEQLRYGTLELEVCNTAKKTKVANNYVPDDGISYKDRRPYLRLDKLLPNDWTLAMTDRENTARHIISWIVYQMFFSDDQECRVDVPIGKTFMVDGHCLQDSILSKLKTEKNTIFKELFYQLRGTQDQIKQLMNCTNFMPIVKRVTDVVLEPTYSPPMEMIYFESGLYNEHGESDFTFFNYIKVLSEYNGLDRFVIYSIDTDTLYNCLWRYESYFDEKERERKRIFWKFAPKPSWCLFIHFPRCSKSEFVDIDALHCLIQGKDTHHLDHTFINYDDIFKNKFPKKQGEKKKNENPEGKKKKKKKERRESESDSENDDSSSSSSDTDLSEDEAETKKRKKPAKKRIDSIDWIKIRTMISKIRNPVKNLIVSILTGGCDYTKGYYLITYEKFIIALARHFDYIGDLIKFTDKKEFQLIGSAYSRLVLCAYMYSKEKRFIEKDKKAKTTGYDAGGVPIIKPENFDYNKIVEKTSTLGKKSHPPSADFITSSLLHLNYYLLMLNQLGTHLLVEPNARTFNFDVKRKSLGWTRKNVQKVFKIDAYRFISK